MDCSNYKFYFFNQNLFVFHYLQFDLSKHFHKLLESILKGKPLHVLLYKAGPSVSMVKTQSKVAWCGASLKKNNQQFLAEFF